jgi:site-specific recombinase XerD
VIVQGTSVGLDVHALSVVAHAVDEVTGKIARARLCPDHGERDLEFPDGLDLHSLRRSYATHLIEDGWDAKFVQDQMGHDHASTTSLYTCVSSDYRVSTLRRVLDSTVTNALSFGEES